MSFSSPPDDAAPASAFDFQPTLRGTLLTLRPLEAGDHDALYAVASDPLIWEQHPDKARAEPAGFRKFFDASLASGGALVAMEGASGAVIGSSRYHADARYPDEIEIGWSFLARRCWGGEFNGEMKRLMLAHAFRFVRRVVFIVDPDNYRSQRAVIKIGGVREANRTDAEGRECVVFAVTAPES